MAHDALQQVLKTYWGFDAYLPLQREAMQCVLENRDSLVVMPTGGGKSLCYQAPALCGDGLAVVVSPLVALMKDQVDSLQTNGIPAAAVNSTVTSEAKREIARSIESGKLRLLYMSPEKLLVGRTLDFLQGQRVSFFAIDEAHCISNWGHDFRPEYRGLSQLKERFPKAAVHAYTATATEHVRDDIVRQLSLSEPRVLVGDFRRTNLEYHVVRRESGLGQICAVMERFSGQSGIVYCISRAEVDRTAAALQEMGYSALPYHAGMSDEDRIHHQEKFLTEQADTIVATVAFGMGIDKSNVRYVIHAGMPKSLEHYLQESGRAGRDGEKSECWLLHSGRDVMTWKRLLDQTTGDVREAANAALEKIDNYATSVRCRHASLIEHFGQSWTFGPCNACDVCLGKLETVSDSLVIAQKILSCVLRVRERYGAEYVSLVLTGSKDQRILAAGHHELSTYGLLKEFRKQDVRQWVEQLVAQAFLSKGGEYNVLQLTDAGRRVLAGETIPTLLIPSKSSRGTSSTADRDSWEGVDHGLFDTLRDLRREEALRRSVPAYIVFGDATLRDMARKRPSTIAGLLDVHGVGRQKSADFGEDFVACIVQYCREHGLQTDVRPVQESGPKKVSTNLPVAAVKSFPLFDERLGVDEVAERLGRALSTTYGYLEAYVRHRRIVDPVPWVTPSDFAEIAAAAEEVGENRLRPIYEALNRRIAYERIRIAIACLENQ